MLRRRHSVATSPAATPGSIQVNEYTSLDLATKNGKYSLRADRLGKDMQLTCNDYDQTGYRYNGISGIPPEHLDALIGLLTVARDKINGFRP